LQTHFRDRTVALFPGSFLVRIAPVDNLHYGNDSLVVVDNIFNPVGTYAEPIGVRCPPEFFDTGGTRVFSQNINMGLDTLLNP
jgi:hypothetical protein